MVACHPELSEGSDVIGVSYSPDSSVAEFILSVAEELLQNDVSYFVLVRGSNYESGVS